MGKRESSEVRDPSLRPSSVLHSSVALTHLFNSSLFGFLKCKTGIIVVAN